MDIFTNIIIIIAIIALITTNPITLPLIKARVKAIKAARLAAKKEAERQRHGDEMAMKLMGKKGLIISCPRTQNNFRLLVSHGISLEAAEVLMYQIRARYYSDDIPSTYTWRGVEVEILVRRTKQITSSRRNATEVILSLGGAEFLSDEETGKLAASDEVAKATKCTPACHVNI